MNLRTNNLMTIQKENKLKFDLELANFSFTQNNLSNTLSFPKLNNSNSINQKKRHLDVLAQLNLTKINKSQDEITEKNFNSLTFFKIKIIVIILIIIYQII